MSLFLGLVVFPTSESIVEENGIDNLLHRHDRCRHTQRQILAGEFIGSTDAVTDDAEDDTV